MLVRAAARRAWARVLALWKRISDLVPPTAAGWLVLALSAWAVAIWGLRRVDLVLLAVGVVGLLVVGLAILSVSLVGFLSWWALRRPAAGGALEIESGWAVRTGFSMPSLWFLPFAELSWRWAHPNARVQLVRERGRVYEHVTVGRRGDWVAVVREFEVADAFGLARVAFRVTEPRRLRAVPGTGALKNVHVVQGLAGGDGLSHPDGPPEGDPFDIRHYGVGDPIRFVLWKVFAKNRTLVVRTPERAISPVQQTVAYLVSHSEDEAAAGAVRVAVGAGALGSDWVLGADGSAEPVREARQAQELLMRSAAASEASAEGLGAFLGRAQPGGVRRAVVFVPPRPGPWLDRAVQAAISQAPQGARVDFVVCADGFQLERPRLGRGWLWERPAAEPGRVSASVDEVSEVVRALGRCPGEVLLLDRVAGQVYPASYLGRLGRRR